MLRISNLIIWAAVSAVTVLGLAYAGRSVDEAGWAGNVLGVSLSPFGRDHNPATGIMPSADEVAQDVALLSTTAGAVRTYGTGPENLAVSEAADAQGVRVMAGAWIDKDVAANRREIRQLIQATRVHDSIDRVIVGNEAILREDVTPAELAGYIRTVRSQVRVPVSTAEPWHVWLEHPELADEVDFIAVHILPYWEGVGVDRAIDFVVEQYHRLEAAFPDKHIVVAEVGWPREGRIRVDAVPSTINSSLFLRRFLHKAEEIGIDYFIIEAFDQPWKADTEGSVGAYWGLFTAEREPAVPLDGEVSNLPNWPLLALVILAASFPATVFLLMRYAVMSLGGRVFLAAMTQLTAGGLIVIAQTYTSLYVSSGMLASLLVLAPAVMLLAAVMVVEGIELAESLWRPARRLVPPRSTGPRKMAREPKVSIHVATCNEPPEMVIDTLNALARLHYSNFEVILIDNNTRDPALWKPVEAHCARLGPRFRFFHFDQMSGFKAGALNFALRQTAGDAEIIAVVDSDYQVTPDWLSHLVPEFGRPEVAIVQAPQSYRDGGQNAFKRMCDFEYAGFFQIGMVERNECNAIIQHGTMTMIRRSVLEEVGAWGEWCICEDTELGLRVFEAGYEAVYTNESFGRGLIPDTFEAYRKQRFRWAYGAIQIMKHHWGAMTGRVPTALNRDQRYHFLAGWLPWFADALNLVFTVAALIWTALMIAFPARFDYPLTVFMVATLSFLGFKFTKSFLLYRVKVGSSVRDTLGASIAGLALSYTVARAVWQGLFTSNLPFLRTPKCEGHAPLVRAVKTCSHELTLGLLLLAGGLVVAQYRAVVEPEAWLWSTILWLQSVPYFSALALSLVNALAQDRAEDRAAGATIAVAPNAAAPANTTVDEPQAA